MFLASNNYPLDGGTDQMLLDDTERVVDEKENPDKIEPTKIIVKKATINFIKEKNQQPNILSASRSSI